MCDRRFGLFFLLLWMGGCAVDRPKPNWVGPVVPAAIKVSQWSFDGRQGQQYQTEHYILLSTLDDPARMRRIAQTMEGAYQQYLLLVPEVAHHDRPMRCYWFANRDQWAEFTSKHAGAESAIYLQILRGGYSLHDEYVAYDLGDSQTFAVAAHEGWHQFVARNFRGRLPPFLEEGLACLFENIRWDNDLPRWNRQINLTRLRGLRKAQARGRLWPLGELVRTHAGLVVEEPSERIEAFYAQSWAFARFMCEYQDGRYRKRMQRLLADVATGTVFDPTGTHHRAGGEWDAAGVKPMLEYYLGQRLPAIEEEFQQFIRQIALEVIES